MKTRNLLFALGCAVAFTACTNGEVPVEAPAMRTVTIGVEVAEPATTRVAYTANEDVYKFAWTSTDELKVLYKTSEGSTGESTFSIDKIKANGKQATFTGELPDDAEKVLIVYSSKTMYKFPHSLRFEVVFHGTAVTDDDSVASALAESTFLYAFADVESSGELPNVKLQHGLSYLLLKKGLKMIVNKTAYTIPYLHTTTSSSCIAFKFNSIWNSALNDGFMIEFDGNGCLTSDYLIPFKPLGEIVFSVIYNDNHLDGSVSGKVTQPPKNYQPGIIYVVAASGTAWAPMNVEYPHEDDFDEGHDMD